MITTYAIHQIKMTVGVFVLLSLCAIMPIIVIQSGIFMEWLVAGFATYLQFAEIVARTSFFVFSTVMPLLFCGAIIWVNYRSASERETVALSASGISFNQYSFSLTALLIAFVAMNGFSIIQLEPKNNQSFEKVKHSLTPRMSVNIPPRIFYYFENGSSFYYDHKDQDGYMRQIIYYNANDKIYIIANKGAIAPKGLEIIFKFIDGTRHDKGSQDFPDIYFDELTITSAIAHNYSDKNIDEKTAHEMSFVELWEAYRSNIYSDNEKRAFLAYMNFGIARIITSAAMSFAILVYISTLYPASQKIIECVYFPIATSVFVYIQIYLIFSAVLSGAAPIVSVYGAACFFIAISVFLLYRKGFITTGGSND